MKKSYVMLAIACLLVTAQILYAEGPPPPIGLVAKVSSNDHLSVRLEWELPGPIHVSWFFKVYRSIDDSAHFEFVTTTHSEGYTDFQVVKGHTYYYYVVTSVFVNDTTVLDSQRSNIASATTGPGGDRPHGVISGTVVDSVTGMPLPSIRILFFAVSKPVLWIPQTWTDKDGHYRAALDTGTYLINAQPGLWAAETPIPLMSSVFHLPLYRPEWYKDAPDPAHATPVTLADSSKFEADFDLVKFKPPTLATINGTVADTLGNPLKGAIVTILRTVQEMHELSATGDGIAGMANEDVEIEGLGRARGVLWKGVTDSAGHYHAFVVTGRSYIALATKFGYLPQVFNHKSNPLEADIIRLTQDTSGIDFSLSPNPILQNSISGVVKDSNGVRVASRIILIPLRHQPVPSLFVRFSHTDSLGAYSIKNVRSGKYFVLAVPFRHYAPAFYKAGAFGVIRWRKADTVAIVGDVTGIDIGVVPIRSGGLAHVKGIIRSAGSPVDGANVLASNAQGEVVGYGLTDNKGAYTIDALPAGQISLLVDKEGYQTSGGSVGIRSSDYAINGVDFTLELVTAVPVPSALPGSFALEQNYPNPFNPSTRISFSLPALSNVNVTIYDMLGQNVAVLLQGVLPAGAHEITWNSKDNAGRSVASGVYFYRLDATAASGGQSYSSMRKMILLK
jgi:hypothetical protein